MKPQALRSNKKVKRSTKRPKRITDTRRWARTLNVAAAPPAAPADTKEKLRDKPQKVYAEDRLEKVLANKASCRKELKRLNALVARVTATRQGEKTKKLYFDEKALAERWSMSVQHIRKLRSVGVGPLVTYFGRSVRYRLRDVQQFEKANAFASRAAKEQSKAK